MYIQENLTTSSIEIPEISWILPAELESKFWQHGSFSKLIFNDDKTAVIDIVEDTGKRAEYEAFIAKEQERIAEETRVQELKAYCTKKGLDFDTENQKVLDKRAARQAKADARAAKKARK